MNVGESRGKGLSKRSEKAVIVGVITANETVGQIDEYLNELEFLALTAGAQTVKTFYTKTFASGLPHVCPKGKIG